MQGFSTFLSSIGVTIIIASMLYALRSAAGPDGMLYTIGNVGFHLSVMAGLGLILTPPIGSFLTLAGAEAFRRQATEKAVLSFLGVVAAASWTMVLISPWFPFQASRVWGWPNWQTAYVYAAILGVLFGALGMRAALIKEIRRRAEARGAWSAQ